MPPSSPDRPQLVRASVAGLFGRFNHSIDFPKDNDFIILVGPNGVGKTRLLEMIHAVLAWDLRILSRQTFDQFSVTFDDRTVITFVQRQQREIPGLEDPTSTTRPKIDGTVSVKGGPAQEIPPRLPEPDDPLFRVWLDELTRTEGMGSATARRLMMEARHLAMMDEELATRDRDRLAELLTSVDLRHSALPESLQAYVGSGASYLIETQRLVRQPELSERRATPPRRDDERQRPVASVVRCARELSDEIARTDVRSGRIAQSLDRSFPRRVLTRGGATMSTLQMQQRYDSQRDVRSRLEAVGILDPERELEILPAMDSLAAIDQRVVEVYLEDADAKLAVTQPLLDRVEFLQRVLDEKFLFKSVLVNRASGLSIVGDDGRDIPLESLSSGEQHELVLLYDLLFNVREHALVMIDEPELSLHVTWQRRLIEDLIAIAKLSNVRFIIATHSPQVIDVWLDQTVELMSGWL